MLASSSVSFIVDFGGIITSLVALLVAVAGFRKARAVERRQGSRRYRKQLDDALGGKLPIGPPADPRNFRK